MEWTPEERADAYLDGLMSREETRAFERDLTSVPETAKALGLALALREMIVALPPTRPPDGLEEKIARALALQAEAKPKKQKALFRRFRAALFATSWTVRGPVHALSGVPGNAQPALAGFSQVRWMLGPFGASGGAPRREVAKKPLWLRALAFVRK